MARKKPTRTRCEIAYENRQRQTRLDAKLRAYAERIRFIESDPGLYPCWGDLSNREAKPLNQEVGDD